MPANQHNNTHHTCPHPHTHHALEGALDVEEAGLHVAAVARRDHTELHRLAGHVLPHHVAEALLDEVQRGGHAEGAVILREVTTDRVRRHKLLLR